MSRLRIGPASGARLRTVVFKCGLLGVLVALRATSISAQALRGILVDGASAPVSRSAVVLLDSASRTVGSALTNERGEFQISGVGVGRYRLRTLRLGFSPVTLDEFSFTPSGTVRRFVSMAKPFSLAEMRVVGRSTCNPGDAARDAFDAWEQVRTALMTTSLSARERSVAVTAVMYERTLDRRGRTIEPHRATVRRSFVSDPWSALGIQALRRGYVVNDGDTTTYYAPGLETLSSDEFLIDHCISMVPAEDSSRVAIAFMPTGERRGVAEIRGTLSLDKRSGELRKLVFGYTNVGRERERNAGGEMTFVRVADGRWFITEWNIHMPVVVASLPNRAITDSITSSIRLTGGELALVVQGNDTLWTGRRVAVQGKVSDAHAQAPVAGVRVDVVGTTITARTNASGDVRLENILPGSYEIELHTDLLDSIGLSSRIPVDVTENSQTLLVSLPTGRSLIAALCEGDRPDTGVVLGRLRPRDGTSIPAGTAVRAQWNHTSRTKTDTALRRRSFTAQARSDSVGRYRICGVPAGVGVALSVSSATLQSEPTEIAATTDQITRADVEVATRSSRASFAGTVFGDSTLRPLADAEVSLPESGLGQRTTAQGTFRFPVVEPGTHRLRVRHIGYGSLDTVIAFAPGQRVERTVVLTRTTTLDSVRVVAGRTTLGVGYAAFEERRRMGFGKFFDSTFLRANEHRKLQDILATIPGMSLRTPARCTGGNCENPPPGMRFAFNDRMRCAFQVVLDGVVVTQEHSPTLAGAFDLNAEQISNLEAVEVYRSAGEVPGGYGGTRAACGVILLWSRQP